MAPINYNSKANQKLIAIIISAFLITFAASRTFVYLVLDNWLPNFFLEVKGVHVHHFTYGVFTLAIVGFYAILRRPLLGSRAFKWVTMAYGVGLGLTFDEFGMWIRLEDDYWIRQSYDAVIIITLLLLNIAYFSSVKNWVRELVRLLMRVFTTKKKIPPLPPVSVQ